MSLIVQKYGGSSVADAERIKKVARRIAQAKDKGDRELDVLLSTGEIVSSTLLALVLESEIQIMPRIIGGKK